MSTIVALQSINIIRPKPSSNCEDVLSKKAFFIVVNICSEIPKCDNIHREIGQKETVTVEAASRSCQRGKLAREILKNFQTLTKNFCK